MSAPAVVAGWLARNGYHVHPLIPGGKTPIAGCRRCRPQIGGEANPHYVKHTPEECECLLEGRPCHGVRGATADPGTVARWWEANPRCGVGVATGPSGLVIIDLDRHRTAPPSLEELLPGVTLPDDLVPESIWHGEDTLALLCEVRRVWPLLTLDPTTLAVRTPTGGLHLWYRVANGQEWRPDASGALGWQVDIRAGWSYAVAPGVTTQAGTYEAVGDHRTPERLPVWLAAELTRVGLRRRPPGVPAPRRARAGWRAPDIGARGYVAAAVRGELEAVAHPSGSVNDQLTRSAFNLGQLVGAGLLEEGAVHQALTDAAAAAGVDPGESKAQSTIRRGIEAGTRKPRRMEVRG